MADSRVFESLYVKSVIGVKTPGCHSHLNHSDQA
jgi:hypothetical protein